MGLFKRLMPKPMRQARRAMHPVSLVTPRPIKNVKRTMAKAVNPVGALGDAVENAAVHALRGGGRKTGSASRTSTTDSTRFSSAPAETWDEPDDDDQVSLQPAAPVIRQATFGEEIAVKAAGGQPVSVRVDDLIDPCGFADDCDRPGKGKPYVAVRLAISHQGSESLSAAPQEEIWFLGDDGAEYRHDFYPELAVPTYGGNDLLLAPGDKRTAYVYVPLPTRVRPVAVQVSIGDAYFDAELVRYSLDGVQARALIVEDEPEEPVRTLDQLYRERLNTYDPEERQVAMRHFAQFPRENRDLLLARFADPDLPCRDSAIKGMAKLADPSLIDAFRGVLQDPVDVMRREGVRALKAIGTAEAIEAIRSLAADPSGLVRREVMQTLAEIDGLDS